MQCYMMAFKYKNMEHISRYEAQKLEVSERRKVGVELESGFRFSYREFELTNRSFIDYKYIILFNRSEDLSDWIMNQKNVNNS